MSNIDDISIADRDRYLEDLLLPWASNPQADPLAVLEGLRAQLDASFNDAMFMDKAIRLSMQEGNMANLDALRPQIMADANWPINAFHQDRPEVFQWLFEDARGRAHIQSNLTWFARQTIRESVLLNNPSPDYRSMPAGSLLRMTGLLATLPGFIDAMTQAMDNPEIAGRKGLNPGPGLTILEQLLLEHRTPCPTDARSPASKPRL